MEMNNSLRRRLPFNPKAQFFTDQNFGTWLAIQDILTGICSEKCGEGIGQETLSSKNYLVNPKCSNGHKWLPGLDMFYGFTGSGPCKFSQYARALTEHYQTSEGSEGTPLSKFIEEAGASTTSMRSRKAFKAKLLTCLKTIDPWSSPTHNKDEKKFNFEKKGSKNYHQYMWRKNEQVSHDRLYAYYAGLLRNAAVTIFNDCQA